ncbi:hypothetical protein GSI_14784 [Ganoderma sinense ZZ0214-1]|uniref:LIM zinc-binding domain-containing protein n=1 Tax=Ganoderma sinense ZZ0214-1 TaxID=1077348 RepID=A0A2G8RPP3_9APHY|nr:hypothetical protein GSI_14784 [Ganoderma sinense ZZ0214-1]
MAQPGYSSYPPQPGYAYSQVQAPQAYDQRMQPQQPMHYQQRSYSPLPQQQRSYSPLPQQQPHSYAPPIQRPLTAINPVPYSSAQPLTPMSAPPPQYDQYYPRAPPSPQPHAQTFVANPYPSPISPASPQIGTPHSSRRPLPSPRGLPQPPNNGTVPTPQPTPSPGPFVGSHRPTHSVPNAFPQQPASNAISRMPSGPDISSTASAFSSPPTSSPRPLPLPRPSGSVDLGSVQSQNQTQSITQSPPKRALPAPGLSSLDQRKSEPVSALGSKFVPLWKRALPQPGGSWLAGSGQIPQTGPQLERRSTVSGGARPLPSPGVTASSTSVSREGPVRPTTTLPHHPQLQNASSPSQSPSQPPQPLPPASFPTAVAGTTKTPHGSRFTARERSRTLPLPTAAPTGPLPPEPSSPSSIAGHHRSITPASSDDEELTNALLERHGRSPSPQFGIRDLPSRRNPPPPANDSADGTPRARRELPSPVAPSPGLGGQAEASLGLRMAATSFRSTSPSSRLTHEHSQSMSSPATARPMPQPPVQRPQVPPSGGWPSALPPLPRVPASPNPISPPATQSAFAQMQARALPTPMRSSTTVGTVSSPFPRSPRKPDLDLNLDDAPPPSLRRSPGPPPSAFPQRSPVAFNSPLPSTPQSPMSPSSPIGGAQLHRAASDASVFTLSNFPAPPTHVNAPPLPSSPRKGAFGLPGSANANNSTTGTGFNRPPSPAKQSPFQRPPSPVKPQPPVQQPPAPAPSPAKPQWKTTISSPSKQWQTTTTSPSKQWQSTVTSPTRQRFDQPQPPSTPKSFSSARSQSPVRFQPPAPVSNQSSQGTPRIPKISFPASADGDSDEDDLDGPVINISGPSTSGPPSLPRISFGDDNDNGIPSINIGGADDAPSVPQISLPGDAASQSQTQRRGQPQTQRMQQTLSNPRMEAAKRSGLVCGGCGGAIIGRIVSAMDMRWHPGCFRCCVCDELLENLSSYAHDGRPYCHLDYHEQFAPRCYHCETAIVDERFITLDDPELGKRTYHEQHFFCAECGDPFLPPADPGAPPRTFAGDGAFTTSAEDDVGFTVYKGHPYCETCHVRLRMPKCKKCKKSIRDGMQAVEALGGKWCWECFTCASCDRPFENPAFFQREGKPFCEHCFSIMIRNEI